MFNHFFGIESWKRRRRVVVVVVAAAVNHIRKVNNIMDNNICEICNEKKEDIEYIIDPHSNEMNDLDGDHYHYDNKQWICLECYNDLLGDI